MKFRELDQLWFWYMCVYVYLDLDLNFTLKCTLNKIVQFKTVNLGFLGLKRYMVYLAKIVWDGSCTGLYDWLYNTNVTYNVNIIYITDIIYSSRIHIFYINNYRTYITLQIQNTNIKSLQFTNTVLTSTYHLIHY